MRGGLAGAGQGAGADGGKQAERAGFELSKEEKAEGGLISSCLTGVTEAMEPDAS